MAVEYAQTPSGEDEQASAGKKDFDQPDSPLAFLAFKAGRNQVNQVRCGEHADEDDDRSDEREQREHGVGDMRGLFLIAARQQVGIDGNEGSGERAFAKDVL